MNRRIIRRSLVLVIAAALIIPVIPGIIWGVRHGLETFAGGLIGLYVLGANIFVIKNMITGTTPRRILMVFLLMIKMIVAAALVYIFVKILGIKAHFLAIGFGSLPLGLTLLAILEMLSPSYGIEEKQE